MLKLERMRIAFDRAFRNEQNENLEKIEQSSNSLQSQINNLVDGKFDDAVLNTHIEEKLNDLETQYTPKLTEVTAQLAEIVPFLSRGKLFLPSDFKRLPFEIFKKENKWTTTATPLNQFDWSDATHVYIKCDAVNVDGLSARYPITLNAFRSKFNNGVYGNTKKFVLHMLDTIYFSDGSNAIVLDMDIDILIIADNPNNFTWIGRVKNSLLNNQTSSWVSNSNVYKSTQTNNHDVLDIVNLIDLDDYGMPKPYIKAASLSECQSHVGTFFRDNSDVYVNPYQEHDINDLLILVSTPMVTLNNSNPRTFMLSNIGFLSSAYAVGMLNNANAKFYAFNSKWYRGNQNAFFIDGHYQAFLIDCVSAYATLDNFNYHSTVNNDSLAVEINCIGYGSGRYKQRTGQPTHSNNGSTAHEGMYMLRVGCEMIDAEGPIIADVDNCYSVNIGCSASDINETTTTSTKAAFYFYDTDQTTLATAKSKFVIECKGYGKNVELGVKGTNKTYVKSFIGEKVEATGGEITW